MKMKTKSNENIRKRGNRSVKGKGTADRNVIRMQESSGPVYNDPKTTKKQGFDCNYLCFFELWTIIGAIITFLINAVWGKADARPIALYMAFIIVGCAAIETMIFTIDEKSRRQGMAGIIIGMAAYTIYIFMSVYTLACIFFMIIALFIVVECAVICLIYGKRGDDWVITYILKRIIDSFYLSRVHLAALSIVICIVLPTINRLGY